MLRERRPRAITGLAPQRAPLERGAAYRGFRQSTLANVKSGCKRSTPLLVFRVARLAKVGVNDVLTGRFRAHADIARTAGARRRRPNESAAS